MSSFESSCNSSSAGFFKVPLEDLLEVSPGVTHDAPLGVSSRVSLGVAPEIPLGVSPEIFLRILPKIRFLRKFS